MSVHFSGEVGTERQVGFSLNTLDDVAEVLTSCVSRSSAANVFNRRSKSGLDECLGCTRAVRHETDVSGGQNLTLIWSY